MLLLITITFWGEKLFCFKNVVPQFLKKHHLSHRSWKRQHCSYSSDQFDIIQYKITFHFHFHFHILQTPISNQTSICAYAMTIKINHKAKVLQRLVFIFLNASSVMVNFMLLFQELKILKTSKHSYYIIPIENKQGPMSNAFASQ